YNRRRATLLLVVGYSLEFTGCWRRCSQILTSYSEPQPLSHSHDSTKTRNSARITHWIVSIGLAPEKGNEKNEKRRPAFQTPFQRCCRCAFCLDRLGTEQCGNQ